MAIDEPAHAAVTSGGASDHTDALAGVMSAGSPLTVNWTGRWGSTAATEFFKATLDSKPVGQTFNVAMLLTNDISTYGWESLQLKVELKDVGVGDVVLSAGSILGAPQIGILAGVGRRQVRVRPRPRVAVVSTGTTICW